MSEIIHGMLTFMSAGTDSRWRKAFLILGLFCFCTTCSDGLGHPEKVYYGAVVNITYKDPETGETRSEKEEIGRYGTTDKPESESGLVVHVRSVDNQKRDGCEAPVNAPGEKWIALIERGGCKFHKKIVNAAVNSNASAVVVYNINDDNNLITMDHKVKDKVCIFITKKQGMHIAKLVDNGTRVMMQITVGTQHTDNIAHINKTSVLFVSISFIVLMIISLAWLVFYYIQRFRYAHAKERLSKRLMNAAKKAITKMPMRTVKNGDKETDSDFDQCAVCIEGYKSSDVIRILPCKHVFHKSCVDPWLIEQRSCPMCKLDILKAYGLQVRQMHGSHESVGNIEMDLGSTSIGRSDVIRDPLSSVTMGDDIHGGAAVEVIRYQPAQVEYHESPHEGHPGVTSQPGSELIGLTVALPMLPVKKGSRASATIAPSDSLESIRSTESDSNETQSLMPQSREKAGKSSSGSGSTQKGAAHGGTTESGSS